MSVKWLLLLAIPIAVFVGAGALMTRLSHREAVFAIVARDPALGGKTLSRHFGYGADTAVRYWAALGDALDNESTFLKIDLLFPVLCGVALGGCLLTAWAALGRPFSAAWIVGAVGLMIVSDWTENLVQLRQIQRFTSMGAGGVEPGAIALASVATMIKLILYAGGMLGLVVLVALLLKRGS